ncbi:hypothetical protein NL676_020923 [Syzygium grande]|nr:hypothetical protein NL676_020923 [Syzygium grande]
MKCCLSDWVPFQLSATQLVRVRLPEAMSRSYSSVGEGQRGDLPSREVLPPMLPVQVKTFLERFLFSFNGLHALRVKFGREIMGGVNRGKEQMRLLALGNTFVALVAVILSLCSCSSISIRGKQVRAETRRI